ncbi:hypothetical protein D3C75_1039560 [compost metagenome]
MLVFDFPAFEKMGDDPDHVPSGFQSGIRHLTHEADGRSAVDQGDAVFCQHFSQRMGAFLVDG